MARKSMHERGIEIGKELREGTKKVQAEYEYRNEKGWDFKKRDVEVVDFYPIFFKYICSLSKEEYTRKPAWRIYVSNSAIPYENGSGRTVLKSVVPDKEVLKELFERSTYFPPTKNGLEYLLQKKAKEAGRDEE